MVTFTEYYLQSKQQSKLMKENCSPRLNKTHFVSMAPPIPTASSTKETTNYARLCRLLVDVGTQAVRDTFNAIHPPANLNVLLAGNKATLQPLRARKIINPTQWGKLFPAIPSSVSSATFDITLLMVLLRNLCGLAAPATGWDALPATTDVSLEADIARIKYFRNAVYAHAEHASVDDATFNTYWSEIRDALVRLGGVTYRAAVDNLETECMDPDVEEHYKELLQHWKNDEDNIKDELKEIGIDIKNLTKKIDNLVTSTVTSKEETGDGELLFVFKKLKFEVYPVASMFIPWVPEFFFEGSDEPIKAWLAFGLRRSLTTLLQLCRPKVHAKNPLAPSAPKVQSSSHFFSVKYFQRLLQHQKLFC